MNIMILLILSISSLFSASDVPINWNKISENSDMTTYIGYDTPTNTRIMLVKTKIGGISTLILPPIPKKLSDKAEKIIEIDPNKMDVNVGDTYVNESDRAGQIEKLKSSGWGVVGEYTANGFNKYRLMRLVPKMLESP